MFPRRKRIFVYLASMAAPVFAILVRVTLERRYGKLPLYILSYPVVGVVAILGGLWAGLLATTTAALVFALWMLPPKGHLGIERTNDAIGLAVFCVMGAGISAFAELYYRKSSKLATYEKEQAIRDALRQSEERFRALVTASSDVMYRMSPDWSEMRQLRNPTFLASTDAPSRVWLQKYIPPDDQSHVMEAINQAIRTRSMFELEHRVIREDGSRGWTLSRAVPLLDADGEIREWFGAASDITERKLAEEALIRSEKLASVGRMAATLAHEVNNPLAGAVNAVYLASSNPAASPQIRDTLALADQELRRAAHITQQTLGFYRESGKRTPVALPKLIEEVVAVYARKLQQRGITVQTRYNCGPCHEGCEACFIVSSGEMRQIISNLLGNGIDALRDNGRLYIRVSRVTNWARSGQDIQLTIADNGCGIRAENLQRIFEPFFTTKQSVGTGLGLWVTQELVRSHNGSIKVRSCRGRGTVFRVSIPATPTASSEVEAKAG